MNTNVLTIHNLLPLNQIDCSGVQKPPANKNNNSFELSLNQIQSKPENAQQITTDNNTAQNTQNNPDSQPQQTAPAQPETQESTPETAQPPAQNTKKPDKNDQNKNSAEDQTGVTEDQTSVTENQTVHILPRGLNIALANVLAIATEKPELPARAVEVLTQHIATFGEPKNPGPPTHAIAAQKTIIEPVTDTENNQTSQTTPNENQAVQNQPAQQTQILDNQLTSAENPETQEVGLQTNQLQTNQTQINQTQTNQPQNNQPQATTEQQQPDNSQPANILPSFTTSNIAVERNTTEPQTVNIQPPGPEQTEPENNQTNQTDTPSQTVTDTTQKYINQNHNATGEQILSTDGNQSSQQNSQTQLQNNQSYKDGTTADTQQLLIEADGRLQNTEQLQSTEQTAKNNSADNTVPPLSQQVQESMQTSLQNGVRQITIQLNPPTLGRVSINFQETAGEITGRLLVSKPETRFEIEQSLPQIIQNLSESGINIKRVEVVLTNNTDQYSLKEQSSQENQSQQNSFNNQQSGFANDGNQSWTNPSQYEYIYDNSPANIYDPQESYLTETSVNMLI